MTGFPNVFDLWVFENSHNTKNGKSVTQFMARSSKSKE